MNERRMRGGVECEDSEEKGSKKEGREKMTWKRSWWIRNDDESIMRNAVRRLKVWWAATRAVEEIRGETGEPKGRRRGEKEKRRGIGANPPG